ncbi:hypothetical protein M0L20_01845 [Spirosoma sp. RP8]|uniref:DUF5683 domain-containing protein n=1 Tax=Spirosoma liriopis TaxID=2937440 RepID=A0ABT0HEI3_9BACT|nr:hypothetical protein [Spirosoma liriopis]MCK8490573.1 hypothetical protein [Spirosoma liriopis]
MRLLFLVSLYLLINSPAWAQERVRNIRLRVLDSTQLEIRYDLVNARPGDSVYFDVRSRQRGLLTVLPQFVRGDIGTRITAGSDRRIVWNALANGYALNEEIQAVVRIKTSPIRESSPLANAPAPRPDAVTAPAPTTPTGAAPSSEQPSQSNTEQPSQDRPGQERPGHRPRQDRYAGPAWALLSAVAPGVGNIFVQWPKPKLGLRPLITIGCYGLAAYGIIERQKSRDNFAIYEQQKNAQAGEPYYALANDHHHRYYVATRVAIAVAATDVVLTLLRGLRNSQLKKEARRIRSFSAYPGLQAGQPTAGIRYSF